jgi:hypothetical protein
MVWASFFGALGRSDLVVIERDKESPNGGTLLDLTFKFWRTRYLESTSPISNLCRTTLRYISRSSIDHPTHPI